ncbi:MAG: LacI family DNA-binding transcriptional regulator, partial [Hungatella sp.]
MKVKVKDIAAAAGVSTTAVSLVLNNRPSRIADDTKEHILRIANEMKLQKENDFLFAEFKRVKTIGLIIPEGNNRFFWKLALEISKVAAVSGYTVFQCHVEESSQSLYQAIESLVGKNVDGILVVPPAKITKEGIKLLKSCQTGKIPMILVDRAVYTVFSDFVTADNKQGGLLATEYLIDHGHTRIGIILGGENVYTSRTRLEGYKAALAAHSIPYEIMRVYYGDFDTQSGETGAEELLKQG